MLPDVDLLYEDEISRVSSDVVHGQRLLPTAGAPHFWEQLYNNPVSNTTVIIEPLGLAYCSYGIVEAHFARSCGTKGIECCCSSS